MKEKAYVWYASYGSNLYRERFLKYILGGTQEGSTVGESGCKDKNLPIDDKPITIPYELYFAQKAAKWQNGGVGFIGLEEVSKNTTFGRMYLITEEQFFDVVKQENNNLDFSIDLREVQKYKCKIIRKAWYGNIIYLGNFDKYPIYTFTSYWNKGEKDYICPSLEYLATIVKGLRETYDFSIDEISQYLLSKKGIEGFLTKSHLDEKINRIAGQY